MRKISVILAVLILFGMVAGVAAMPYPANPTGVTRIEIPFDGKGNGSIFWNTDKGIYEANAVPVIIDGRVMVPFRSTVEAFGGSAVWQVYADGSTSNVILNLEPTVETKTVTVYKTANDIKVVNNSIATPLSVNLPYSIEFWGVAPQSGEVLVTWTSPTGNAFSSTYFADLSGYFRGYNNFLAGSQTGLWKITATQPTIGWSSHDTFTLNPVLVVLPYAPTNLSATTVSTAQINLAWTDNAFNELGYQIERKVGAGPWIWLTTVGINATTFQDTGLTPATAYTYRVYAFNSNGISVYSNESLAVTLVSP